MFENEIEKHTQDYLLKVEIKDYNVMVNGKKLIDQLQKNDLRTYENIQKFATGQGDDYNDGCFLDYNYFKNYYKMIDLSKQQAPDADPKTIQQSNFTENLERLVLQ